VHCIEMRAPAAPKEKACPASAQKRGLRRGPHLHFNVLGRPTNQN
jgi:hypothetical protein